MTTQGKLPAKEGAAPADTAPKGEVKLIEVDPVYGSSVQIQLAGNDVILTFRRPHPGSSERSVREGTHSDVAVLRPVAAITLSPLTIKDLTVLLQNFVQNYEKDFGPIVTAFTKKQAQADAKKKQ